MQMVYNNVVDNRVFDEAARIDDVTSIGLPSIEHPTSDIDASGMIGKVTVPDMHRFEAMTYSIAHNKGLNSHVLVEPRVHRHEFRIGRQRYNTQTGEMELVPVKYRLTGMHTKRDNGNVERGNPMGNTDEYSCVRYEEEIDGETAMLIDIMTGDYVVNGVSYGSILNSILD